LHVSWPMNIRRCTWVSNKFFALVGVISIYGRVKGRSVTIGENDFDTLLPDIDRQEEDEPWTPANCDPMQISHVPVPGRIMSCFRAAASLCES
jgi:hypothetical protein